MSLKNSPLKRVLDLVREEKSDITAIYFFAILNGLIQLSLPLGIQSIISFVLGGTFVVSLVVLITILVVAVLFVGIMQINQMQIIEKIQQRIFVKYAFAFADTLPKLDLKKIDAFYLPELVNRFFDTTALQKSISKLLLDLPTAFIQIIFGLILLSFYHPMFILFGILLLLLLWLILYTTGSRGLESSLAKSSYKYKVAGWFEEMARLFKTFKFSSVTGLHLQKADQKTTYYLTARTTHFKVLLLQYKTLVFFKVTITAAMLSVGVALLLNQQINIGQFVATEIIIIAIIAAVEKIIVNLDSVYDVLTAVEKISQLTDKPLELSGNYALEDSGGISIEAKDLSYAYDGDRFVIKNVSFSLAPGESACVMGADGAGKTTLLKLLLGVYKDYQGLLLINNIPIGNYDLQSLRSKTGILFPQ
ncbi:MAG TPA: ABC transporter ATP-binding protein, partial [Flavisolibacter sp.]|nr:ABC transporter ATP-binding protein [Flavisolibacter sp.]